MGTDRDCTYMLELRAIEQGILADLLFLYGIGPGAVSRNVRHKAAALLWRWRQ